MSEAIERFWSELPDNPEWDGPCPPPEFDQFAPPRTPIEVHCLHCGLRYDSRLVAWGRKNGMQIAGGIMDPCLWWCPSPACDGGSFGHDIYPIGILGGNDAEPLTLETVAAWKAHVASVGKPKRGKEKYDAFLKRDAAHCDWLADRIARLSSP